MLLILKIMYEKKSEKLIFGKSFDVNLNCKQCFLVTLINV